MSVLDLNLPICLNKTFLEKPLSFSCTYQPQIKSYKDKSFSGPNWPKELYWNILVNIDGSVDLLKMKYLKPKYVSGNIIDDTPKHLWKILVTLVEYHCSAFSCDTERLNTILSQELRKCC